MSIDGEEETEQGWWSMSPERMRRLKEKEDKAYIEAIRKVLREKGTPFFLLSPSQLDLPSGFCTSRSVHRNRWEWFMDFRIKAESNFYDSCVRSDPICHEQTFSMSSFYESFAAPRLNTLMPLPRYLSSILLSSIVIQDGVTNGIISTGEDNMYSYYIMFYTYAWAGCKVLHV